MRTSRARPTGGLRWGLLALTTVACLVTAAVAGFLGLIFGGDFASGGRAPVRSALFWAVSGAAAALPIALPPALGLAVRRPVAVTAASALALVLAVAGWVVSAA